MTLLKGVIFMTLIELAVAAKVMDEISIPTSIRNLEIENSEDFCRYSEGIYLKSIDFKNDLIEILNHLVENSVVPLKDFSLQFVKNESGKLQLKLADFMESL